MSKRVVITGLGLMTPLGTNMRTSWKNLLLNHSGIINIPFLYDINHDINNRISLKFQDQLNTSIAAIIPNINEINKKFFFKYNIKKNSKYYENLEKNKNNKNYNNNISRFIEFSLYAAEEALLDSGLLDKDETLNISNKLLNYFGICVGSGMGSIEEIRNAVNISNERGLKRLSPYFIPKILINLAAGHIAIKYGLKGPIHSAVTACATGAHSIGDAYQFIKNGNANIMLAGGTESSINELSIGGFSRMRALASTKKHKEWLENPTLSSCPFDKKRDGFIIGEGAGILILEDLDTALKRNANIICEIKGYGLAGDAYHITAPSNDGDGAKRAMKNALVQANLSPKDINYINAHATSTPLGDNIEANAIEDIFYNNNNNNNEYDILNDYHVEKNKLKVSSNKGSIGHLLGAAGAVEAIFSILSLKNNILPHTKNLNDPENEYSFELIKNKPINENINNVMNNSFGFGGTNTCLIFSKFIN